METKSFYYNILLCLIFTAFLSLNIAHGNNACSQKDADMAENMVDTLDTWVKIDTFFKNFKQCDDGSIAEGLSEAVARLLADHWNTLPDLSRLIKHDPPLKLFITVHIDTTINDIDLKKIRDSSSTACPNNLTLLCSDLNNAATRSINRLKQER